MQVRGNIFRKNIASRVVHFDFDPSSSNTRIFADNTFINNTVTEGPIMYWRTGASGGTAETITRNQFRSNSASSAILIGKSSGTSPKGARRVQIVENSFGDVPRTGFPFVSDTCNHGECQRASCGGGVNVSSSIQTCTEPDTCSDPKQQHMVQCCSNVNITGWLKQGNACPWTARDNFAPRETECQDASDFATAAMFCASFGARLCTRDELVRSCGRNPACGHDRELVWTTDAADPPVCIQIITGPDPNDSGYLSVFVDQGTGSKLEPPGASNPGYYVQGAVVLDVCYPRVRSLRIRNTHTNAWAGSISVSTDGRRTYTAAECPSCPGGLGAAQIVVDANIDGVTLAQKTCLAGAYCTITWEGMDISSENRPDTTASGAIINEFALVVQALDAEAPINATYNWWGVEDEYVISRRRISDIVNTPGVERAEYYPFLLDDNIVNVTVAPINGTRNTHRAPDGTLQGQVLGDVLLGAGQHRVSLDLVVAQDASLTFAPGARVLMGAGVSIVVKGKLVSAGTAEDPVVISSNPVCNQRLAKPEHLGCFTFSGYSTSSTTPRRLVDHNLKGAGYFGAINATDCFDFCYKHNYQYASLAIIYARRASPEKLCMCDESITATPTSGCSYKCADGLDCGNYYRQSVYRVSVARRWGQITIGSTSTGSLFTHTTISGGGSAYERAMVEIESATPMSNVEVTDSGSYGAVFQISSPVPTIQAVIEQSAFSRCARAGLVIKERTCARGCRISRSSIQDNHMAGMYVYQTGPTIGPCLRDATVNAEVSFFRNSNFQSSHYRYGVGSHGTVNSGTTYSSIIVPIGLVATVYFEINFVGSSQVYTEGSYATLVAGHDNNIRSVVVTTIPGVPADGLKMAWHDLSHVSRGVGHLVNCSFYEKNPTLCTTSYNTFGHSSNTACCACSNGGVRDDGLIIEDSAVVGNGGNHTAGALAGASDANHYYGIYINNDRISSTATVRIVGTNVTGSGGNGLRCQQGRSLKVMSSLFENNANRGAGHGIRTYAYRYGGKTEVVDTTVRSNPVLFEYVDYLKVSRCTFEGQRKHQDVLNIALNTYYGRGSIVVADNVFRNTTSSVATLRLLGNGLRYVRDVTIHGNSLDASVAPVAILLGYKMNTGVISNTEVTRNRFGDQGFALRVELPDRNNALNVTHNWWGSVNEYTIEHTKIFDIFDAPGIERAEYYPFLLDDNIVNVTVAPINGTRNTHRAPDGTLQGQVLGDVLLGAGQHNVSLDLVVAQDASLTFAPGARVLMGAGVSIVVKGKLVSAGTAEDPVVISSNPVCNQRLAKPEHLGCFTFSGYSTSSTTPRRLVDHNLKGAGYFGAINATDCFDFCYKHNYQYASLAIIYARRASPEKLCMCDESITATPTSGCSYKCADGLDCGNYYRQSVYRVSVARRWGQITIGSTSTGSLFTHTTISGGGSAYERAMVEIESATPMSNVEVTDSGSYGAVFQISSPVPTIQAVIEQSAFSRCARAGLVIKERTCARGCRISRSSIQDNHMAGMYVYQTGPTIGPCLRDATVNAEVSFFRNSNFQSSHYRYGVGSHGTVNSGTTYSSIIVPIGLVATVYFEINFVGSSQVYTEGSYATLVAGHDNNIRSVVVTTIPGVPADGLKMAWHDLSHVSRGVGHLVNCSFYEKNPTLCTTSYNTFGHSSNTACCACSNGGVRDDGLIIEDSAVVGNGGNHTAGALAGASDANHYYGIYINNDRISSTATVRIVGTNVTGSGGNGLRCQQGRSLKVMSSLFENNANRGAGHGIRTYAYRLWRED